MKTLLLLMALSTRVFAADSQFGGGGGSAFSGTADRAVITSGAGALATSAVTATELGYVSGVTSALQTQLGLLAPKAAPTFTGLVSVASGTSAAPTVVGPGTASDSGLYFDGTTPCLARDGVPAACFSGAASYFGLPAGQSQYGMYYESNHFYVRGLSGNDSRIKTKIGTTTFAAGETFANIGGVRYKSTTATGNVGTGEDDLQSVALIGNSLGTNGEAMIIESNGTLGATANNKQVKLYFGSTVVADTGVLAINNGSYRCRAEVTRTAATTQIANGMCWMSDGTHTITVSNPTQTLSSSTTVKATAEATDNDDISSKLFKVNYEPYGN